MTKTKSVILSVALSMVCLAASNTEACTTTIVTKGASAGASAYVTHSNDSFSSDPSIVYVPAKDHPAGAMRKVYPSAIAWDDLSEYECYSNPRLVAPLPEAYAKNDRTKYDPAKAWWISQQVTTLTKGYYSAMAPKVLETAHKGEQRSMELVASASGQSKEEFANTLRGNAERVLTDWRGLYGKLLAEHDGGHGLEYDKAFQPKADKVLKY